MMSKHFTVGTALLAAASALPQTKSWNALQQVARFDNDVGIPAVAVDPVGIYLDIYWQGMTLVNTGGLQDSVGVTPNSRPNYAAFSALATATITEGQPSMMTNYEDSTIDHFDLQSFYYGCVVASQASIIGVPVSCTVSIKGYTDDAAQHLVASQSFGYTVGLGLLSGGNPGSSLLQTRAQMLKATVDTKFVGLKRVDFEVSNDLITAALIDTVSYKVYSEKNITP
jgi:hypothetical protein